MIDTALIFGDGACSGNPGPGGWGTVILTADDKVIELGGYENPSTNNRMELTSFVQALMWVKKNKSKALILMDSTYVLKGATEWIHGWKRRGWKTAEGQEVANREIWEELDSLLYSVKGLVSFGYVPGHKGIPGNERTDEIAVGYSRGDNLSLYRGNLDGYRWNLRELPDDISIPELKHKTGEKKVAYSYLSNMGGIVYRHSSWASCEARVKGKSGARFKKAMSASEELQILSEWGVDPGSVKGG